MFHSFSPFGIAQTFDWRISHVFNTTGQHELRWSACCEHTSLRKPGDSTAQQRFGQHITLLRESRWGHLSNISSLAIDFGVATPSVICSAHIASRHDDTGQFRGRHTIQQRSDQLQLRFVLASGRVLSERISLPRNIRRRLCSCCWGYRVSASSGPR